MRTNETEEALGAQTLKRTPPSDTLAPKSKVQELAVAIFLFHLLDAI
jgi:hypothetical protein